jgi:aryl-alcohol dehydrogenase-like predicted oxidoreductase
VAVQPTDTSDRDAVEALGGRAAEMGPVTQVIHAAGVAVGPVTHGRRRDARLGGTPRARFDMDSPANQRKLLDDVEELAQLADKAGLTLIELAIAFVISHPAVTSAIIGPRTMEQLESQLPAAEVALTADVLDRIDQLVAPGTTINPDDNSYGESELTPAALRRTP